MHEGDFWGARLTSAKRRVRPPAAGQGNVARERGDSFILPKSIDSIADIDHCPRLIEHHLAKYRLGVLDYRLHAVMQGFEYRALLLVTVILVGVEPQRQDLG